MGLTFKLHDHFGILYDSFGITCIGVTSQPIIPEQVSQNVKKVHEYIKSTQCEESKATNGPQETVSQKTQNSVELQTEWCQQLVTVSTKITLIGKLYLRHK